MQADGLFVYGSLRTGGQRHGWLLRTRPLGLTEGFVAGRLFHLPAENYPALVPVPEPGGPAPGPGWVVGEFVGYEDEQELDLALQDLDQVEDVEGGLFERRVLPVLLASGHRYLAWVYVFPEDRLPRLEREAIERTDGDWGDYLA